MRNGSPRALLLRPWVAANFSQPPRPGSPVPPAPPASWPARARLAAPNTQDPIGDGRKRPILLRGGIVLTLDPESGRLRQRQRADRGEEDREVGPNVPAPDAEEIDCSGTIVMPGFITTHHHQYETMQRSIIADGASARRLAAGKLWVGGSEHLDGRPDRRREQPGQGHLGSGPCPVRSRGLLHRAARRLPERDQRGGHLRDGHLAGQSHACAHRRHDQGTDGLGPTHGLRLQRGHEPERRGISVRISRGDERHVEGDRPDREDLLQLERPAGDAGVWRRPGTGIPGGVRTPDGSSAARSAR